MPVHKVETKGKTGYRWGNSGKIYYGPGAKEKAAAQGRAAYAAGWSGEAKPTK